jgi:hypothetical protein
MSKVIDVTVFPLFLAGGGKGKKANAKKKCRVFKFILVSRAIATQSNILSPFEVRVNYG